ncbi:NADH-quinone oxidoreductase subunit G [Neoehrlichia mikurensis]|uniref:NADH-quinone oxidoreductase n=1 Tax=Neoehrlichia mikurensis TaxID=89586 RepID=A0A9Q9BSZ9_9RICK|nr:NADH-quinone oxidoreductase subunit NuoG [Neoehrlichia mikurensis]QXK91920.1 NADH-quinone oxidoreductase subunit G [Neoehrlichia mikurensis]QXK93133.1 NADH-quinone oxidoreductase subunit G [Neoehrlichia mikurensis]QXK93613.1 NADH-quinone oxidoreductase subunit G [Neoehrlichia mikurensis]UTO55432.1 NADH-quinone oxidoreductase subunit NuoG [Neoehrlichia mikurensis]UTO56352.1 NADH-quinone oxidoreductase subunit NuoG [Neoehrlichia mikurensis]
MVKLIINSQEVEVDAGMTVLQACEIAGIEIPRFCYHERLAIAGNCRMCLVEIANGPPKPAASCAMPVADGMVVNTNTDKIKKAREGVLEFLLINHPLDCPICDQGGECDLQDQVMAYGCSVSRYCEEKRAVSKKNFGPLIENMMTRCIHCTRCIRFLSDVAGTYDLGTIGRGELMEIDTYIAKGITSEISGNIIDLCPVGALTSKPYSFKARSWELSHCETIDVLDAVGSNIRVDCRGLEVMRILPRVNEEINEEWISDKTRFSYDGLKVQRLDKPYMRRNGKLVASTWEEAFFVIAEKLKNIPGDRIAAIAGDLVDCESMLLLKELMHKLGSDNIDCRQDGAKILTINRALYLFNTSISKIEEADLCILINTNIRFDAPMINTRIRKRYLQGEFVIASIGPKFNYNYQVEYLGDDCAILQDIFNNQHSFCEVLNKAKKPMLIIGQDGLIGDNANAILVLASKIAEKFNMIQEQWNGFNVLHKAAARVGGLDVGFIPKNFSNIDVLKILKKAECGDIDVLYLLGADEINLSSSKLSFVIYQGHHCDNGAQNADIVLPGAAYTEKIATYVNTEGRAQRTTIAIYPPGIAKEDWLIIKELSQYLGKELPYNSVFDVQRQLSTLGEQFKEENIGKLIANKWLSVDEEVNFNIHGKLTTKECNFYMTNSISRSSSIMANCAKYFIQD